MAHRSWKINKDISKISSIKSELSIGSEMPNKNPSSEIGSRTANKKSENIIAVKSSPR